MDKKYKNKPAEADFSKTVYALVRQIPRGSVASYGQIAALSGNPRRSRVVGSAMRTCADPSVPCHRVVYRDGRLSSSFGAGGANEQTALLKSEGVPFLADGRVNMKRCTIRPGTAAIAFAIAPPR